MKWWISVFLFFLILFIYMFIQALLYKTRQFILSSHAGYRFMHLSDIHIGLLCISAKRINRTIQKVHPDFILISGDFLDHPKHLRKLEKWLKKAAFGVPAFAVLGNHDHRCFRKYPYFKAEFMNMMKQLNIQILVNEIVPLTNEVALIGIDDCKTGVPVDKKLFEGIKRQYKCVLAFTHNPDAALNIPPESVDLFIAGHFHGGQIWMPFNLEYVLFRRDKMSKMGYLKGFASIRKNQIYISRGLGSVLFPFRFLSIPEITVFDI